jgi:hypothetical protein
MRISGIAVAGGLLLSACSTQPPTSGVTYAVYRYGCCAEISSNDTWHAGQHLTLHWQQQAAGATSDATPHQMVLSVSLTGPFASVDALKQGTTQGTKPAGARTISAAPLTIDDRSVVAPASQLDLPSDLAPGYYNLATGGSLAGQSWGGGAVVIVAP